MSHVSWIWGVMHFGPAEGFYKCYSDSLPFSEWTSELVIFLVFQMVLLVLTQELSPCVEERERRSSFIVCNITQKMYFHLLTPEHFSRCHANVCASMTTSLSTVWIMNHYKWSNWVTLIPLLFGERNKRVYLSGWKEMCFIIQMPENFSDGQHFTCRWIGFFHRQITLTRTCGYQCGDETFIWWNDKLKLACVCRIRGFRGVSQEGVYRHTWNFPA